MHCTSRMTRIGLWLIMSCSLTVMPRAGGSETDNTGNSGHSGSAETSANSKTGHSSGSSILCAGLLGSGILGDVFTIAPLDAPRREDPNTAIQSGPIWSDTHQTTIGAPPSARPPQNNRAVATVRLPISFSETDRQKFVAAGWKPRRDAGGRGISYCLDRAGQSDAAATPAVQGIICVAAAL
jgi:hypothetical protein